MRLSIERASLPRVHGELQLFDAKDGARRRITLAVSDRDWSAIQQGCAPDPVAEVEYLALSGRWTSHDGRKVWFVARR